MDEDTATVKEMYCHGKDGSQSNNTHMKWSGDNVKRTCILFSLSDKDGVLADTLAVFKSYQVSLHHIESRPSKNHPDCYQFLVYCDNQTGNLQAAIAELRGKTEYLVILSDNTSREPVPLFPRKISDLDEFANHIVTLGSGPDLIDDPVYCARQREIQEMVTGYTYGQPIPRVTYTDEETQTWRTVYRELKKLYPKYACREFNDMFSLLEEQGGYTEDRIPQLEDVSNFLKDRTGFTLRPVTGFLSPRDFLAGFAFRVFHATQYIRHSTKPMYSPEPDICHELLGHVPMFADPVFAEFSHEIGLASLGVPDEYIEKLSACYWFTVEFGLCQQEGQLKAFGAALLSSFGELQYSLSDKPERRPFDPANTALQEYPITQYQPVYYVSNSFESATSLMRNYAATIPRPFTVRYNAYTKSVEVIESKCHVVNLLRIIKGEVALLEDAVNKLN